MNSKSKFYPQCIEALYRRQLSLGQALGVVEDLEVIQLFEDLSSIEKHLLLAEQTGGIPTRHIHSVLQPVKNMKSMAATEFFKRTQI